MKKEFTRKELIHKAVNKIRVNFRCAEDEYMQDGDKMLDFISNCTSITFMLENLGVTSFRDSALLRNIIDRKYQEMLERKYK